MQDLRAIFEAKSHLLRRDDYRKTTRSMMDMFFTNAEMASSSLTGGKGHTGSTKAQLDATKTSFLICEYFHCNRLLKSLPLTYNFLCLLVLLHDAKLW